MVADRAFGVQVVTFAARQLLPINPNTLALTAEPG
jgi:hypothetical protein